MEYIATITKKDLTVQLTPIVLLQMVSIPKMLVIIPILLISKIPVLVHLTIICSLTLLCLCGCVPLDSVGELPSHSHAASISASGDHMHTTPMHMGGDSGPVYTRATNGGITHNASTNNAGSHSHTINVSSVGDNLSHNNMQPYMPVYMWRRTAQRAVGELPEHGHVATCSTDGNHVHTAPTYNGSGGAPNGRISEVDRVNRVSTVTVDKAGSHSHTISVSDTGKNLSHNNMSPYLSVYIWKRTA